METKIRIALQKKGRLNEQSIQILTECGISFSNSHGTLVATSSDFPIELLYLRDDDIPQYVADGVADIGIVGKNEVLEQNKDIDVIENLGFSKCRMSLAIPKDMDYTGLSFFNNKRIATSYPGILSRFLQENNLQADIHEISGSVEIAPGIGLADVIFDIVSSGSTLISNRLKEVEVIIQSEAQLVGNKNLSEAKKQILSDLLFRMQAVRQSKKNKYIVLNAPNSSIKQICSLLPGMKSPTIIPLAEEGWSSVHSVVHEKDFWSVIGKLKTLGAQGILVMPIEKMIL